MHRSWMTCCASYDPKGAPLDRLATGPKLLPAPWPPLGKLAEQCEGSEIKLLGVWIQGYWLL